MLCFCHMIKAAGTTLNYIFRNNYGYNFVETQKEPFTPKDLEILLSINRNIKAIAGHHLKSYTGLDSVCSDLEYITFLREPIDRYISHYNHSRTRNYHQLTLEEWTKKLPLQHAELNYQTKFIAGSDDLERAKKILANDFAFVGLAEKFDESLILMKKILNLQDFDSRYQRMNVNQKKLITKNEISHDFMEELRELNKLDYELYRFINDELFEEQKCKYGSCFVEELNNFRLSNENYKFRKSQLLKFRIGKYLIYAVVSDSWKYLIFRQYQKWEKRFRRKNAVCNL